MENELTIELSQKFIDRLMEAMKDKGYKQADLAGLTNIDKGAISHYLSGSYAPKADKIYTFAKVLGVSSGWLMGLDVPKHEEIIIQPEISTSQFSDAIILSSAEKDIINAYRNCSDEGRTDIQKFVNYTLAINSVKKADTNVTR